MLKFTPLLLAVLYALAMYQFSSWRTRRNLDEKSTELADATLKSLTDRMATALGVERIRVNLYEVDVVNGLAAPDGRIFLTRGFYEKYRRGEVTAEELASVIAHELGHVALGPHAAADDRLFRPERDPRGAGERPGPDIAPVWASGSPIC